MNRKEKQKNHSVLQRTFSYREFIFLLRLQLAQKKGSAIAGLATKLGEEPSFEEKTVLVNSVKKKGLLRVEKDGIHLESDTSAFLRAMIDSPDFLTLSRPEEETQGILTTLYSTNGTLILAEQNVKADRIVLSLYGSVDDLMQDLMPKLDTADQKKVSAADCEKAIASLNLPVEPGFKPEHVLMLSMGFNNGKAIRDSRLYLRDKTRFLCYLDLHRQNPARRDGAIEEFEDELSLRIGQILTHRPENMDPTDGETMPEAGSTASVVDVEPMEPLSFAKIVSMPKFPANGFTFLFWFLKNTVLGMVKNWKKLLFSVLRLVILSGAIFFWNMYATCYLNDTFSFDRRALYGRWTAYVLGGLASIGNVRNVNTAAFVAPLYLFGGMLLHVLFGRILTKKLGIFKEFAASFGLRKRYASEQNRSRGFYFGFGLIFGAIVCVLLRNPLPAIPFGLLLLVFYAMAQENAMAALMMLFASACARGSVEKKGKTPPRYSALQLLIRGAGIGLLIAGAVYTALWMQIRDNLVTQILLAVIFVILGLFAAGVRLPRGVKNALKVILFFAAVGTLMRVLGGTDMLRVFADDGGWTESGRTLKGLIANMGFSTILGISAAVALSLFVPGGIAIAAGLGVGLTTLGLTSTNEYWHRSADSFIYGKYSDYDPTLLSMGANMAVGLVPGVGDLWSIVAGTRDLTYDAPRGDIIGSALDIFAISYGFKGLVDNGFITIAKDGANSIDDVANFAGQYGDDAMNAAGQYGDDAINAAGQYADDAGNTFANLDDADDWVNGHHFVSPDDAGSYANGHQFVGADDLAGPANTNGLGNADDIADSFSKFGKNNGGSVNTIADLTPDQYTSFQTYTGNSYQNINASLRGQEIATASNQQVIANMQEAFSNTGLADDMIVYRGTSTHELGNLANLDPSDMIGKSYNQAGFMSTSSDINVAMNNFHGDTLITIKAPKGSQGLDISGLSNYKHESEILFNSGQNLVIREASRNPKTGILEIVAEIIN